MKRLGMAILGILLCAQLGGCGKPAQQTETVSGYVITEIELPDPNEDIPEEEEWDQGDAIYDSGRHNYPHQRYSGSELC